MQSETEKVGKTLIRMNKGEKKTSGWIPSDLEFIRWIVVAAGGEGRATTNRLKSNDIGGGKPEGVVIETEGRKTFKSKRVVNFVRSCRAVG